MYKINLILDDDESIYKNLMIPRITLKQPDENNVMKYFNFLSHITEENIDDEIKILKIKKK